ncbi:hypothetical protein [Desulfotomaculum nigrificans]|uniref:hypothetical protein n=1 Tax=Desulfotomaculum nigrificans TaxID=1565 RepID=UPI0001FAE780|nr:hypothetical protein [Desulfotomaculum nigrificans]
MDFKKKILPFTLTLCLAVGSLGIANAAVPVDFQQKMAGWIQNDPNPMPMNMNTNTTTTTNTNTGTSVTAPTTTPATVDTQTGTTTSTDASTNTNTASTTNTNTNTDTSTANTGANSSTTQTNNTATTSNTNNTATPNQAPAAAKKNVQQPVQNDVYTQMMQNCINMNQQMMNMTPEQMLEMDKAWMDAMSKKQQSNSNGGQQWSRGNSNWGW